VLDTWLPAASEEDIKARFAAVWKAIRPNDLDTLTPWVLTAAIDFITTETGALNFRELAHRRLAPVRLRYGVPQADMCELVRDGFDRDDAVAGQLNCLRVKRRPALGPHGARAIKQTRSSASLAASKIEGYPDTAARRGPAPGGAGHDVGKPCRENYAA